MKVEICGVPIKGLVGVKSKIYTSITEINHKYKRITML